MTLISTSYHVFSCVQFSLCSLHANVVVIRTPIKPYLKRANVFFKANSIAADKWVPVSLRAIYLKIHSLLPSLTSSPSANWQLFLSCISSPNRYLLQNKTKLRRRRNSAILIAEYIAELQHLSMNCEFGNTLNNTLQDLFVESATQVHTNAYLPI